MKRREHENILKDKVCRGECIDGDERCKDWAALGECKNNPSYMLTTCRLACKVCKEGEKSSSQ